ncbi:hypothetical protein AcW1_000982 [Taiwanofungus camphoratus]|nr:hypothetical protein AcW2_000522 [Antrodia cinnamomea]KAI0936855.1 hypothetical protein AcV5_004886 [Antrodia cinnamomea]KAI0964080.1 hypothetical protein AcW1_000982 [Antrodia cinnamomea]
MSTRVQKGGTVFRPVARPRARPGTETQQTSAVSDINLSTGTSVPHHESVSVSRAASLMSPLASKPFSAPPGTSEEPLHVPAAPNLAFDRSQENAAPASSTAATAITLPSRDGSRPPMMQNHLHRVSDHVPLLRITENGGSSVSVSSRTTPVPVVIGLYRTVSPSVAGPSSVLAPPPTERTPAATNNKTVSAAVKTAAGPIVYNQAAPHPIHMSQIDPRLVDLALASASHSQAVNQGVLFTHDNGHGSTIRSNLESSVGTPGPLQVSQKQSESGGPNAEERPEARPRRTSNSVIDAEGPDSSTIGRDDDTSSNSDVKATGRRRPRGADSQTDGQEGSGPTKRRKRGESTAPRRSRTRAPSVTPFDPNADPGEELDPTVVTMSALCDDTGQGRISSNAAQIMTNHAAWRASNREKRARLKAMMEAKKYGRNPDDDEQPSGGPNVTTSESGHDTRASRSVPSTSAGSSAPRPSIFNDSRPNHESQNGDDFDYTKDLSTSRYNVQVRIGANGETIIDEESLFVNRNEEDETENYTHVEESDTTKFVNSSTYSKKLRGSRWSAEETELFYDALSQFGENYELISYVLPGRDRKACKNKFKAEDKKNPTRVTYCLNNRRPYDIQTLSRMTGKDFSGPTPIIKAPTPLRSTELDSNRQPESTDSPKIVRKQSRTPGVDENAVVMGDVGDIEKDDSIFGDGVLAER